VTPHLPWYLLILYDSSQTSPWLFTGKKQGPDYKNVQRNLALELVRVTEAAALAGGKWYGRGDKNAADQVSKHFLCILTSVQHTCFDDCNCKLLAAGCS